MTKILVKINHTTFKKGRAKAHLVEDAQGRQGWIMARSLNENSEVTAATFEKAAASYVSPEEKKRSAEEERTAFLNAGKVMVPVADFIEGESASGKAVYMTASWAEEITNQTGNNRIYFPKSMIKDGALPQWLLEKKATELREELTSQYGVAFEIHFSGQIFNR